MGPRYSTTTYAPEYQEFVQEDLYQDSPELTCKDGILLKKKLAIAMNVMTVSTWLLGILLYFL